MRGFIDAQIIAINKQHKKAAVAARNRRRANDPDTVEGCEDISLTQNDWDQYVIVKKILEIPNNCTLQLQKSDISLADLYGAWVDVELKLKGSFPDHQMSKDILAAMEEKRADVIGNELVLACMYLHPRNHFVLTEAEKTIATDHITKLWTRLDTYKKENEEERRQLNHHAQNQDTGEPQNNREDVECSSFQQLINSRTQTARESASTSTSTGQPMPSLFLSLRQYEATINPVSLHNDMKDPSQFWDFTKNKTTIHANLYAIARIVFAAAPTQVSVERAFSGLAFIYNPLRTRLGADRFNDIMILRQNTDMLFSSDLNRLPVDDSDRDSV